MLRPALVVQTLKQWFTTWGVRLTGGQFDFTGTLAINEIGVQIYEFKFLDFSSSCILVYYVV